MCIPFEEFEDEGLDSVGHDGLAHPSTVPMSPSFAATCPCRPHIQADGSLVMRARPTSVRSVRTAAGRIDSVCEPVCETSDVFDEVGGFVDGARELE
jgi:hypothetical protein